MAYYEMKPCPFCGCDAEVIHFADGSYSVECTCVECVVMPHTIGYLTEAEAIEGWNTRDEKMESAS